MKRLKPLHYKALRFKLDKSRYNYIQAQVMLRVLLGKYLNLKPEQIVFVKKLAW